ncbi:MAG TPA: hypothetical protein GXX37_08605 [Clostridiaceae bacterium]|nr:hypothetical protein [Clostridiaceae bacterium]
MFRKVTKGSVTLEAAIALSLFISVILSVSLMMKIIYTHEIIQNALSLTANELSSYSYLLHLSGIERIHDKLHEKMEEIVENVSEEKEILNEFYEEFTNEFSIIDIIDIAENPGSENNVNKAYEDVNDTQDADIQTKKGNNDAEFQDEMKNLLYSILKEAYGDSIDRLFIPIAKMCIKKYLVTNEIRDPDERLKALDVNGGFNGLDFSMSELFKDENNTISIVVKYKINMPVPIKILPSLTVIQKASVRGWLGGDEVLEQTKDVKDDIWSLDNFTRGRKIREIFGANLPFTFPVIARYDEDSGTVTMIKSMDLTLEYYQDPVKVSKKMKLYINELKAYRGQEVPWGKDKIVIKNSDIVKRQLILVVPNNPINLEVEQEIEQCRLYAADNGIDLKVIKYGTKR